MTLKKRREDANLTQKDLAAKVGVNQTAVSQWERGLCFPSLDKISIIAQALNCSAVEIAADILSEGEKDE